MNNVDRMSELQRRVCEALGIEPKDTLSLSLHFHPGDPLTADIKHIVRIDKAPAVVQAIEDARHAVKESIR